MSLALGINHHLSLSDMLCLENMSNAPRFVRCEFSWCYHGCILFCEKRSCQQAKQFKDPNKLVYHLLFVIFSHGRLFFFNEKHSLARVGCPWQQLLLYLYPTANINCSVHLNPGCHHRTIASKCYQFTPQILVCSFLVLPQCNSGPSTIASCFSAPPAPGNSPHPHARYTVRNICYCRLRIRASFL